MPSVDFRNVSKEYSRGQRAVSDVTLHVVHGTDDDVVPFDSGKALFDGYPGTKKTMTAVPRAKHNDMVGFILNDPVDLEMEIVAGEERYLNIGATVKGRVLLVVTTWREDRVRVVTAFEPIKRLIQFYYQERER